MIAFQLPVLIISLVIFPLAAVTQPANNFTSYKYHQQDNKAHFEDAFCHISVINVYSLYHYIGRCNQ